MTVNPIPWTDVATAWGTIFAAVATVAAVIVALYQSHRAMTETSKAREDLLQARKDKLTPLVFLDWGYTYGSPNVQPGMNGQPYGAILNSLSFGVTNVGEASALNVCIEVESYGKTEGLYSDNSVSAVILDNPRIHLVGGKSERLVIRFNNNRIDLPVTLKIRLTYCSVLGECYESKWYSFDPQNGVKIPIKGFEIPSKAITG